MVTVVLERDFATRSTAEDLHKSEKQAAWCNAIYGVEPKLHYLSSDGMRVICIFEAPDAESLRQSGRRAGFEHPGKAWSSTVFDPPDGTQDYVPTRVEPDFTLSIVERSFDAPVEFDDIQAMEDRAASCLHLHRVRFVRTYFSLDKMRMLCLYEAPDAESVRLANREASLPFDRVWASQIVLPAPPK